MQMIITDGMPGVAPAVHSVVIGDNNMNNY